MSNDTTSNNTSNIGRLPNNISYATWPEASPHSDGEIVLSVSADGQGGDGGNGGEAYWNWTRHDGASNAFHPHLYWRTTRLSACDLEEEPCVLLDKFFPASVQEAFFGASNERLMQLRLQHNNNNNNNSNQSNSSSNNNTAKTTMESGDAATANPANTSAAKTTVTTTSSINHQYHPPPPRDSPMVMDHNASPHNNTSSSSIYEKYPFPSVLTRERANRLAALRSIPVTYCYILSTNNEEDWHSLAYLLRDIPVKCFIVRPRDFLGMELVVTPEQQEQLLSSSSSTKQQQQQLPNSSTSTDADAASISTSSSCCSWMTAERLAACQAGVSLTGVPALIVYGGLAELTYTAVNAQGQVLGGGVVPGLSAKLDSLARLQQQQQIHCYNSSHHHANPNTTTDENFTGDDHDDNDGNTYINNNNNNNNSSSTTNILSPPSLTMQDLLDLVTRCKNQQVPPLPVFFSTSSSSSTEQQQHHLQRQQQREIFGAILRETACHLTFVITTWLERERRMMASLSAALPLGEEKDEQEEKEAAAPGNKINESWSVMVGGNDCRLLGDLLQDPHRSNILAPNSEAGFPHDKTTITASTTAANNKTNGGSSPSLAPLVFNKQLVSLGVRLLLQSKVLPSTTAIKVPDADVENHDYDQYSNEQVRQQLLGCRLIKPFDNVPYRGTIESVQSGGGDDNDMGAGVGGGGTSNNIDQDLYSVLFDDGDREDLESHELYDYLQDYSNNGEEWTTRDITKNYLMKKKKKQSLLGAKMLAAKSRVIQGKEEEKTKSQKQQNQRKKRNVSASASSLSVQAGVDASAQAPPPSDSEEWKDSSTKPQHDDDRDGEEQEEVVAPNQEDAFSSMSLKREEPSPEVALQQQQGSAAAAAAESPPKAEETPASTGKKKRGRPPKQGQSEKPKKKKKKQEDMETDEGDDDGEAVSVATSASSSKGSKSRRRESINSNSNNELLIPTIQELKSDPQSVIDRRIAKFFADAHGKRKVFFGTITKFTEVEHADDEEKEDDDKEEIEYLWHIKYDDDDEEEMLAWQVIRQLKLYSSKQKQDNKKLSAK